MSRRAVRDALIAAGAYRRLLADRGLGPMTMRGIAASPAVPPDEQRLLDLSAELVELTDRIDREERRTAPIALPAGPSPARLRGDAQGVA